MGPPEDHPDLRRPFGVALDAPAGRRRKVRLACDRSAFIHGDSIARPGFASDGCIISTHLPDGEVNGHAVRLAIVALRLHDDVLQVLSTPPAPADAPVVTEGKDAAPYTLFICAVFVPAAALAADAERSFNTWNQYLGGADSSQYSALKQINKSNVKQLEVAWTYATGDNRQYLFNPIVIETTMYVQARTTRWSRWTP